MPFWNFDLDIEPPELPVEVAQLPTWQERFLAMLALAREGREPTVSQDKKEDS